MSNVETFVLVELEEITGEWMFGQQVEQGRREIIKRIVRTYESRERANQDLELLQEAMPASRFNVQAVEFIDR